MPRSRLSHGLAEAETRPCLDGLLGFEWWSFGSRCLTSVRSSSDFGHGSRTKEETRASQETGMNSNSFLHFLIVVWINLLILWNLFCTNNFWKNAMLTICLDHFLFTIWRGVFTNTDTMIPTNNSIISSPTEVNTSPKFYH